MGRKSFCQENQNDNTAIKTHIEKLVRHQSVLFFIFMEKAVRKILNTKEDLKPTDQNLPITPELLSQIDHAVAVSFGLDGMLNPKEKEEDPDGAASG